jgi:hypothetical protein
VNCIATDATGNSRSGSFTVLVKPQQPDEPTFSIEEERSSCNPDPNTTFADFAIYMRVDGIPLGTSGGAIVTMESIDGVETLVYRGWSIGQIEQGWIAGGIESIEDVGEPPYTLTFYEAIGPDPHSSDPYNPETDIYPKAGGATTSLTFTCEDLDAEVSPNDILPPVISVPADITEEATTANGGTPVTFTVTSQDNIDGTVTLEEDGTTITQDDDIGGSIMISCDPSSGSEFPIGETTVQCIATDAAGNEGTSSFTVTVNPPPPPPADTTSPVLTVSDDIIEKE